jgi:hypothetical protein
MIRLENMLTIGSSGSNAGKTELVCALFTKIYEKSWIMLIFSQKVL